MSLSPTDKKLLIALREGGHIKGNPAFTRELLDLNWQDADAAFRRLRDVRLVKETQDSSKPGSPCCRLTDQGVAQADILIEERDSDSNLQIMGPIPPRSRREVNWSKSAAIAAWIIIPVTIISIIVMIYLDKN